LVAVFLVVAVMEITGVSYATYLRGAQMINFMLASTVVLLAVPLYRRLSLIKQAWPIIAAALLVGLPTGVISAIGIARLCEAGADTMLSLAPKSVTTGIAIGISESIGGMPALTAVFVITTGIVGAMFGPWIVRMLKIDDDRILGI
jgi:putative effector of murein hydrolase